MSFVITAWQLTLFFIAISVFFFYLSSITDKPRRRMVEGKEILFLIGLAYIVLAHYAMFISIGQAYDENYQSPCENLINQTNTTNNVTTYTYFDSCDTRTPPGGSSALVVIYTWLLFVGLFGLFLAVLVYMVKFAQRFV